MNKYILSLIVTLMLTLSSWAGTGVVTINNTTATIVYPTNLFGTYGGNGNLLTNIIGLGNLTSVINFSGNTNSPSLINLTTNLDSSRLVLWTNANTSRFTFSCVVTNPILANTPFLQVLFPEIPLTTNGVFITQTLWHCPTGDQPTNSQSWLINVYPYPSSNSVTFYTGGVNWTPSSATNIVSIRIER